MLRIPTDLNKERKEKNFQKIKEYVKKYEGLANIQYEDGACIVDFKELALIFFAGRKDGYIMRTNEENKQEVWIGINETEIENFMLQLPNYDPNLLRKITAVFGKIKYISRFVIETDKTILRENGNLYTKEIFIKQNTILCSLTSVVDDLKQLKKFLRKEAF